MATKPAAAVTVSVKDSDAFHDLVAYTKRLEAYAHGLESFISQVCRSAEVYDRVIGHQRKVHLQHGDLGGKYVDPEAS